MQLIFDSNNIDLGNSILDENKMTSIDQGSNGEKFATETNQQNCVEVSKEKENCPEVPKSEKICPKVCEEEEISPVVLKNEEKCPEMPKDDNVQKNGIIVDDVASKKESPNGNETKHGITLENCATYENDEKTRDKEYLLKITFDSVEATKIDTAELAAESNVPLAADNFETTKGPSVNLEIPTAVQNPFEDTEMSDDKGIVEEYSVNKIDIEQNPTNNISEETIEEKIPEKAETFESDDLKESKLTCDVTNIPNIEKFCNDLVLENRMAGAGDSKITATQIEEKLTKKDVAECFVDVTQVSTTPGVINEAESLTLKPESEKHVPKNEVENVNSEVNIDETEILTDSMANEVEENLDEPLQLNESLEIDENALNEPLRLDDSLEIEKRIINEDVDVSAISAIESAPKLTMNTQSVDEDLEFPDKIKSSETVEEKSVEETLPENESTVERLVSDFSDTLSDNVELASKSSESTVAKTSSSDALEAKSDESILSDDINDGKTSPEDIDSSKQYDGSNTNTVESETRPLDTIIEETKSAYTIPESSKSEEKIVTINNESAEKQESIDIDDIDMEPAVTDTSKEENMSIDCDDSISFVTANDNDDVSIVSDTKQKENSLEKPAAIKLTKEKPACDKQKVADDSKTASHPKDTFQLSNKLDILSDDEEESPKQIEKEKSNKKHSEIETSYKKETPSKIITLTDSQDLNILSDDDEKSTKPLISTEIETLKPVTDEESKDKTINLDDDDDIMLIDDDTSAKSVCNQESKDTCIKSNDIVDSPIQHNKPEDEIPIEAIDSKATGVKEPAKEEKEEGKPEATATGAADLPTEKTENPTETAEVEPKEKRKPLVPENFFKSYKKNLTEMSRDDLEEFCILKIVESIIDRSTLNETKTKLKAMTQSAEEYKKKVLSLIKQQRDLQVVLKSVQEEQKNKSTTPIAPLKITRSVGMQVLMTDKNRRKPANVNVPNQNASQNNTKQAPKPKPKPPAKLPKLPAVNNIPVPKLVPASNAAKAQVPNKPMTNGIKTPPVQKPEKRTHSKMTSQSVTVDLTDDEPPAKFVSKSPSQPVRLVPPQNLMTPRGPNFVNNSPRKVFIPISGSGSQQLRPGQTIMVKNLGTGPRQRNPNATVRLPQSAMRVPRPAITRHPAPLPDAMKQYQPPNWKPLPPAPDLKLSKVENGIVISWKIEGVEEDSYEEIASYQLFAYQETTAPPNTNLWKKIGDVKALPLPMACTLTQFMAGYKYYFAVRAVDIRSRLGPFSLPGSIILVNKL